MGLPAVHLLAVFVQCLSPEGFLEIALITLLYVFHCTLPLALQVSGLPFQSVVGYELYFSGREVLQERLSDQEASSSC